MVKSTNGLLIGDARDWACHWAMAPCLAIPIVKPRRTDQGNSCRWVQRTGVFFHNSSFPDCSVNHLWNINTLPHHPQVTFQTRWKLQFYKRGNRRQNCRFSLWNRWSDCKNNQQQLLDSFFPLILFIPQKEAGRANFFLKKKTWRQTRCYGHNSK